MKKNTNTNSSNTPHYSDIIKCYECGSRNLKGDRKRAETFCIDCGLVLIDNLIEETTAGKTKDANRDQQRDYEPNDPSFQLGSQIGVKNSDGSFDNTKKGRSLRRQNQRQLPTHKRSQQKGIIACKMLLADLGAGSDLRDQVVWNYKRLLELNHFKGQPLDIRAAAIVYFTYKDNNILRSIEEISELNSAHPRQVARLARKIATAFRRPWVLSRKNVQDEIRKFGQQLELPAESISKMLDLSIPIEQMADGCFLQKGLGFTGAIMYLAIRLGAGNSYRTQRDISDICRITEVTLRNNYKIIMEGLGITKKDVDSQRYTLDDIITGAYKNEEEE